MPDVPSILLVDDNVELVDLLGQVLGEAGYRVRPFHRGRPALESIAPDPPALGILDLLLPDILGYDIGKELASRGIPFVFMTGVFKGGRHALQAASKHGCAGYFEKPFDTAKLLNTIKNLVPPQKALSKAPGLEVELDIDFEESESLAEPLELTGKIAVSGERISAVLTGRNLALEPADAPAWANKPPPPALKPAAPPPLRTAGRLPRTMSGPPPVVTPGVSPWVTPGPSPDPSPTATPSPAPGFTPGPSPVVLPGPAPRPTPASSPAVSPRLTPAPPSVVLPGPSPRFTPGPVPAVSPGPSPRHLSNDSSIRRGQLRDNLAQLFTAFWQVRGTGELGLQRGNVKKVIYFQAGWPVFALSNLAADRFGSFLCRIGKIAENDLNEAAKRARAEGCRTGDVLIEMGLLKDAERMYYVAQQVKAIIYSVFAWEAGDYVLSFQDRAKHEPIQLGVHPAHLIARGIKKLYRPERLQRLIALEDRPVPSTDPVFQLSELELEPWEAQLLPRITGERNVAELIALTGKQAEPMYATLAALLGLKVIEKREG